MKYLFSFLIGITLQVKVNACAFPPKTFMTSLSQYIAVFEVVQIDTVIAEGMSKNRPLILTKLKVVKSFTDSISLDYVWMSNPGDEGCQRGLFPNYIGQKYVITGKIFDDKRYKKWIGDSEGVKFLHVSVCGQRILNIKKNNVIGVITSDISEKIMKKYDRLVIKDVSKARAYYQKAYNRNDQPYLIQTIPLYEFYKMMES